MKKMQRLRTVFLPFLALLVLFLLPFQADAAGKLRAKDVDYKNGKIEIEFNQKVQWKSNAQITVTDSNKNTYTPLYVDKENDEVDIYLNKLPQNGSFNVKITGIRARGTTKYTTVTASFKTNRKDIVIEEIEYDDDGLLELEFKTKLQWKKNAKVTVTDADGKKYTAKIRKKDSDECDIRISNIKPSNVDRTFTFIVSGVKSRYSNTYTTITGSFEVKKTITSNKISVKIDDVDYDEDDEELEISFKKDVRWKNAKIKITDTRNRSYEAEFIELDDDECTIYVEGLKPEQKYNFKITGIKGKKDSSYGSISGSFYVDYDD